MDRLKRFTFRVACWVGSIALFAILVWMDKVRFML